MKPIVFEAYAVTNEIDLNKIAIKCNIPKKYTWEEPLILRGEILGEIIGHQSTEGEKVLVFSFGSIVFINLNRTDMHRFFSYMKEFKPEINLREVNWFTDSYELQTGNEDAPRLTDQYAIVREYEDFYPELISMVIAKSVALEKTEAQLEKILDQLEEMINRLEKGRVKIGSKELARTTSRVIRHEYNTIAYIMILDRPDVTWTNSQAEEFYDLMSKFFELNDRYEIIRKKTDILKSIIDGFTSINFSIRGLFVEWVIVLLILIEIVIMFAEFLK